MVAIHESHLAAGTWIRASLVRPRQRTLTKNVARAIALASCLHPDSAFRPAHCRSDGICETFGDVIEFAGEDCGRGTEFRCGCAWIANFDEVVFRPGRHRPRVGEHAFYGRDEYGAGAETQRKEPLRKPSRVILYGDRMFADNIVEGPMCIAKYGSRHEVCRGVSSEVADIEMSAVS